MLLLRAEFTGSKETPRGVIPHNQNGPPGNNFGAIVGHAPRPQRFLSD
jgi:hypothetical protein